jgi:2,3-bisphosphoglycerate-dependent phosphoglycerate mutase
MIYFTRHGESEANIEKVFANKCFKYFLTNKGIEQTKALSEKLKDKHISIIYVSPVLRAIQTAEIISKELGLIKYEVNELLREYDVGNLEGKSDPESWAKYAKYEKSWETIANRNQKMENGESFIDIELRFEKFIQSIQNEAIQKNVLIISHGGLLKIGLPKVVSNMNYSFTNKNQLNNCDLVSCKYENGKIVCYQYGNKDYQKYKQEETR